MAQTFAKVSRDISVYPSRLIHSRIKACTALAIRLVWAVRWAADTDRQRVIEGRERAELKKLGNYGSGPAQ